MIFMSELALQVREGAGKSCIGVRRGKDTGGTRLRINPNSIRIPVIVWPPADRHTLRGWRMVCPDKLILLMNQQEGPEYAQSVSDLKEYTAAIPLVEYMLLLKLTKHTLTACQAAQRCLQRHVQEHGCAITHRHPEPFRR